MAGGTYSRARGGNHNASLQDNIGVGMNGELGRMTRINTLRLLRHILPILPILHHSLSLRHSLNPLK
jgi:hypothetical protein